MSTENEAAEEAFVIRHIQRLLQEGTPAKEIAVLYRFNAQSARFEAACTGAGIPYNVADNERFFERPEIRQPLVSFGRVARTTPDVPGLELLRQIVAESGFDPDAPPAGAGAARSRWEAVAALLEMLEQHPEVEQWDAATLLVELNRRATEAHAPTQGGVTLATLHKSKGLEFDAVFCVALTEGSLPSAYAKSPEQLEEERRLFYVGITRARTHLFVSWAKERPGPNGQTWKGRPSQFLDDLTPPSPPKSDWVAQRRAKAGRSAGSSGPSPSTCAQCGNDLKGMPARRLGRCSLNCLTGDEARLAEVLAVWRTEVAEAMAISPNDLASDRALFSLVSAPPGSHFELHAVAGLNQTDVARFGPDLVNRIHQVTMAANR